MTPKIAAHTLGCKVNQYDTEQILKTFQQAGFEIIDFCHQADIYLINTCAVTQVAEHKSRQFVAKAKKTNPLAKIIITGCAVKFNKNKKSNSDLVEIVEDQSSIESLKAKQLFAEICKQKDYANNNKTFFKDSTTTTNRVRRFLVIQRGCEQFCSYCVIPYLRGRYFSNPLSEIVSEAKYLIEKENTKEIILTGINLGSYGIDLQQDNKIRLTNVVEKIAKIDENFRIRLSSIEPQYWDDDLLKSIKNNPKVCNHFHIPIQSASENVLKLMNRPTTLATTKKNIESIYNHFPDAAITADIIVGFPGETDSDFNKTYSFLEKLSFAKLHIFKFSQRSGTKAEKLPNKIKTPIIKQRADQLQKLNQKLTEEYQGKFVNKKLTVLWEQYNPKTKQLNGLSDNYLRFFKNGNKNEIGSFEEMIWQ